jgi:hypothetical protein
MSKAVWGILAVAVLAVGGGIFYFYYEKAGAENWEQEIVRRNVEVGGPGGPLPMALWPGTPRKVALDSAQAESKGRFAASSGLTAKDVNVPGMRISEEPCAVHLNFHADRLLGVTVIFDSSSPVSANRLKLLLQAKYGEPRSSPPGNAMSWKIEKPPPFTVTAGQIGTQLVVIYLDAGEVWRSANEAHGLDDVKKLVEKMDSAK